MKTPRVNYLIVLFALVLSSAFVATSCSKDKDKKATAEFRLTDAPATFDAVNIDIVSISVHHSVDGWVNIPLEHPGVYNLLSFSNGVDTLLGKVEFSEGKISQIRFVLGIQNSIVVEGITLPLIIPSGSTSGLKFNVHADIVAGVNYRFWIDFDAAQSIVVTGSGTYKLKPVIRMFEEATSGSISGVVAPLEALPVVKAYNNTDTLMALPSVINGMFVIKGVPAGVYSVEITPANILYKSKVISDVNVTLGQTANIGTVTLELN